MSSDRPNRASRSSIAACPLRWPRGRVRTAPARRRRAVFSESTRPLSVAAGVERLIQQFERLGADAVVVSTNMQLRREAGPRSDPRQPIDPGVAVHFCLDGRQHCMSCDLWDRVADNVAALARYLDAIRGQLRLGVAELAQAFAGFALPPDDADRKPWWQTLGFSQRPDDVEVVRTRRRDLAAHHHPDRGGSHQQMSEINQAYEDAMRDLAGG